MVMHDTLRIRVSLFLCFMAICMFPGFADAFQGGGGGFFFGTGFPGSVDAADELSQDLGIDEQEGNFNFGAFGFYQGDAYRIGGSFQVNAWGGWNVGDENVDDDTAGIAAWTGGFYGTWSILNSRLLLNLGGIVGAGRLALGYNFGKDTGNYDRQASTSIIYLEPQFSVGVAAAKYVGFEFVLSAPIYLLDEDLTLSVGGKDYTVESSDLSGIQFSIRFVFGVIADL